MSSPLPTILLDILYLIVVIGGMRLMRDRKPFSLKPIVAIHNLLLVAVSAYMVVEMIRFAVYEYGYRICDPVDYHPSKVGVRASLAPLSVVLTHNQHLTFHLQLARVLWVFYYSKVVEFFDTVRRPCSRPFSQRPSRSYMLVTPPFSDFDGASQKE